MDCGHPSIGAVGVTGDDVEWRRLLHRGASGAFVVSVAGTALGFAAHVFVARVAGKADYGVYALMLSWVSVLAVFAQAGQDFNVVRFLPTYVASEEWGKARGLRRGIGLLVLGISVAIALVGSAVIHFVGAHHSREWRETFYIGFAMLPVLTELQQSGAVHRAFKRAAAAGMYTVVVRPVILIALLGVVVTGFGRVDAPLAAAASAVATVAALAASAWHLSKAWPLSVRHVRAEYEFHAWVRMGLNLSVFAVVWAVGNRVDVLILGGLMGTADVGPYYAAVQIAGICAYTLNAVNVIFGPMVAERYDAGDLAGLQRIARRASRLSLVGAVVSGALIAVVGYWLLGLFGRGFESAYVPLLILVSGCCVTAGLGPVDSLLALTRFQKLVSLIVLLGVVVNGVVAAMLIPRLGAIGAAIAWSLSLVVWRFLAFRYGVIHLGINISAFPLRPRIS